MPGPSRASAALDFLHGVPHPLLFLSLFCVLLGLECCFLTPFLPGWSSLLDL